MTGWRQQFRVRRSFLILCLLVLAGGWLFSGQVGKAARKFRQGSLIAREIPAPPKNLSGRLTWQDGIPILELWGNAESAGYAQGWLLADEILALFDGYILDRSILPEPGMFDGMLRPGAMKMMDWPFAARAELTAMYRGMVDRLGADQVQSRTLARPIVVEDLMTVNAFADFHGVACSSFSAWGRMTPDGRTVTGRNLDFPKTDAMERRQLVVVRRGEGARHGWVGVSWPGLIGVYTAMSDVGVTMLMHDAPGLPRTASDGFTPRSLILREALESAGPESYLADIRDVFAKRRVMVGNNIHVSGSRSTAGSPAGVFEYDGNGRENGVQLRQVDQGSAAPADFLATTNHMRCRREPQACERYSTLANAFTAGKAIDVSAAFLMLDAVSRRDTLHSVVCLPDKCEMLVRIPALTDAPVPFKVRDWLKRADKQ